METDTSKIELDRSKVWIIVAIYLSIFINSYVFFKEPVEFQFGYLIYFLLLPAFVFRHKVNIGLVAIFFVLLITGIFNIFVGNNSTALFLKVFTGLFLSYFFYYYVIVEFNCNVEQLFKWYLKGAYYASLLGLFQFISYQVGFKAGYTFFGIFNKWGVSLGGIFGIRVNSVFAEPTHLAAVLSAAFFISFYNLFRRETFGLNRFQSAMVILVYIMSFSGLGQIGIFLSLVLLGVSFGLARYIFVIIPAALILFNVLYNNVTEFKERYDGLFGLFSGEKFKLGKTHGSSYILYNNYKVAIENFKGNFMFGTGIGSHPVAYDKYSEAKNIKVYGFALNSADANSMLLRLISETGLFGVTVLLYLMFKCYVRRNEHYDSYHWLVSNSILVMILLNLFRQGHYFLNGFPFFVILYYYNWTSYNNLLEGNAETEQDSGKQELLPEA